MSLFPSRRPGVHVEVAHPAGPLRNLCFAQVDQGSFLAAVVIDASASLSDDAGPAARQLAPRLARFAASNALAPDAIHELCLDELSGWEHHPEMSIAIAHFFDANADICWLGECGAGQATNGGRVIVAAPHVMGNPRGADAVLRQMSPSALSAEWATTSVQLHRGDSVVLGNHATLVRWRRGESTPNALLVSAQSKLS